MDNFVLAWSRLNSIGNCQGGKWHDMVQNIFSGRYRSVREEYKGEHHPWCWGRLPLWNNSQAKTTYQTYHVHQAAIDSNNGLLRLNHSNSSVRKRKRKEPAKDRWRRKQRQWMIDISNLKFTRINKYFLESSPWLELMALSTCAYNHLTIGCNLAPTARTLKSVTRPQWSEEQYSLQVYCRPEKSRLPFET